MDLQQQVITAFDIDRDHYDFFMIELDRFDQPMTRMLIEFLKKRYGSEYWFVVDIVGDQRIDAYIIAGLEKIENKSIIHIYSLAVRRECEGNGWAKRLMDHLVCKIKDQNLRISYIALEVMETNTRAIRFYKKYGFRKKGREEDYYGQGVHAIVMSMELNNYQG